MEDKPRPSESSLVSSPHTQSFHQKTFWERQWKKSTPYVDFSFQEDDAFKQAAMVETSIHEFCKLSKDSDGEGHLLVDLPDESRRYIMTSITSSALNLKALDNNHPKPPILHRLPVSIALFITLSTMSFLPLFVATWLHERPYLIAMITTILRTVLMSNLYFRSPIVTWPICAKFLEERAFPSMPTAIFFAFSINPTVAAVYDQLWFRLMAAAVSGLVLAAVSFTGPLYHEWRLRKIRGQARSTSSTKVQRERWAVARDKIQACKSWAESQKHLSLPMADHRSITLISLARAERAIAFFVPYQERPRATYGHMQKVPTMMVGLAIDISQLIAYREQPVFFAAILVRGAWTSVKMALLVFSPHVSLEETNNLFSNMYAGTFFTFITLTIWYLSIGPVVVAKFWSCAVITLVQAFLKQTFSNHTSPVLIGLTRVIALPFGFVIKALRVVVLKSRNFLGFKHTT